MDEWEEKRREEIKKEYYRLAFTYVTVPMFLDKILYQEKEMLREFAIEIFDNNDVMIHKHILNDRINKILKDRGVKEI